MGWMEFILSVATLVLGTGWIFTYRAYKRKNEGEAAEAEANGWKAQQDVYQQTIDDLKTSCEYIRADRNLLRDENKALRAETEEWRDKYKELERQFDIFKKEQGEAIRCLRDELARQGRKLESIFPFACGVAGCQNRTRVEIRENIIGNDEEDNYGED